MARKKVKKAEPKHYVILNRVNNEIVDSVAFPTCGEAEDYVESDLKAKEYEAEDVVICELKPILRPLAPVTEVQWEVIK